MACWALCRRKFHYFWVAKQSAVAGEAIDRIRQFYDIEDTYLSGEESLRSSVQKTAPALLVRRIVWRRSNTRPLCG